MKSIFTHTTRVHQSLISRLLLFQLDSLHFKYVIRNDSTELLCIPSYSWTLTSSSTTATKMTSLKPSESVSCSVVSDSVRPHMVYNLPGSSVHGILQARILEWVAIPFSRGSSQLRNQTQVSSIAGRLFTI